MKHTLFTIIIICISILSFSQAEKALSVDKILADRGEIYFRFSASPEEIAFFSGFLSIDKYDGKEIFAYANEKQFIKFLQISRDFSPVEEYYNSSKALNMAISIDQMQNWDKYPTYEVYVSMMQKYANDYPEICRLDTIGYSTEGRLLLCVKISDNVSTEEAEPEFLYSSTMHGDELFGGILYLRLIDYLLSLYGSDSEVTDLVNNLQIYISPFANPDGTYYGGNQTVADSRRNNAQGIDLNRNFPDAIAGNHPDGEIYATETQAFMDFAAQRNFVMGANSHGGAELVNYPYDTWATLPADNDWWYMVSREYALYAQTNSPAGYFTDYADGVTNGYAWYSITGSRQDYMNYFHNCREVTLELHSQKKLDSDLLPNYWEYNRLASLNYLKQATYGLRGIVTDSISQEPLEAEIYIDGFDYFNSHIYSFPQNGDYYRYLYQGNYVVRFSAPGYKSKTYDINVLNNQQTILDVQLVSLDLTSPLASFYTDNQNNNCSPAVIFVNDSEASFNTEYIWDFGDGNFSQDFSPVHTYSENGQYTVKLVASNEHGADSLIMEDYVSVNLSPLVDLPNGIICDTEGTTTIEINSSELVYWYENISDIQPIHTGNSFTTPLLNQTSSYYVQEKYQGSVYNGGEAQFSDGGEYINDNTNNYLIFDCYSPTFLHTVKVYAESEGVRNIYLRNSNGEIIASKEIFIEAGMQIIELDFNIPEGADFRLGCESVSGLFRGFSGIFTNFAYPYNIADKISIKQSNVVLWNDGKKYYAYFYDWTLIEPDCFSAKTEIIVYVNMMPEADFDFTVYGTNASFDNTSVAADSYHWDFGDGNNSQETNPEHVYQNDGEYTVVLTATSECGDNSVSKLVNISGTYAQIENHLFKVYPNPANDIVYINSDFKIKKIILTDISGRVLKTQDSELANDALIRLEKLPPGIYFLNIELESERIYTHKIFKN